MNPISPPPSPHETRSNNLIYLVEAERLQADVLIAQVDYFGYRLQACADLTELRVALGREASAAILMDLAVLQDASAAPEAMRALQAEGVNLPPIFFFSVRDDVPAHLQAIRAGGKDYFAKPVDVSVLVDALDKQLAAQEGEPYRVLIVDDSQVQARVNALHLQKAGITSQIITDPLGVKQALEDFHPDLLLLDLYMPECTGLELAQVIRQMKTFVSLPIVYLSAETDREKQLSAVGLGGDDFLTKPIKPEHLVSAVTSRIERYRQLRTLMLRDSLTGLLNHTTLRERLGQEMARTVRQNQPLALGMIDLDHFKKVNDTYGHATGDRILKSLARMLTHRLRQSDIIGRYGGEEFVVIMPNTSGLMAWQVLQELGEVFSQVKHLSEGREFTVTFSCGVAASPHYQTPAALSEAADRAMYVAKRGGRNQVVLADPTGLKTP
jgi:diguanylate cyclase (GGDEF)-like protein